MNRRVQRRSPWIEQLEQFEPEPQPRPLSADASTDVLVIGAGIAGLSTAFFVLRDTDARVLLVERGRAGHGATGHNAGQLTTYFERPLPDIVAAYGFDRAMAGQRAIDESWGLLETMVAESGATLPIDRFVGHMGMFTLDHLRVHLRSIELRRRAGLSMPTCIVADDAPFLDQIPDEFEGLYTVATNDEVRALLGTGDDRYCAVLSDWKGCANGALLIRQVLHHLEARFADRFRFVDRTPVERVVLDVEHATVEANGHRITAKRVVMCTNGFVDHIVENLAGDHIGASMHHQVTGTVGYMVGFVEDRIPQPAAFSFIRNEVIGEATPYVYSTTRAHHGPDRVGTLVCIGGPERELDDTSRYDPDETFPNTILREVDTDLLPIAHPTRPAGLDYDYVWHGLMAYTGTRVRLIGEEPRNPVLLYNLGCNGVGFLPSIHGGHRIARIIRGDQLEPSIFDPP